MSPPAGLGVDVGVGVGVGVSVGVSVKVGIGLEPPVNCETGEGLWHVGVGFGDM